MTSEETSPQPDQLLQDGIAFHRDGDLTSAQQCYNKVLEHNSEQPDAIQLLGVIAAQIGDTKMAIQWVEQSISINPQQPGALNNLGNMLVEVDRYDEAFQAYKRSIELAPEEAKTHRNLGSAYRLANRPLDAIHAYRRATELDPSDIAYWRAYGDGLDQIGAPTEAVEAFQKALEIDPSSIGILERLGKSLRTLRRLDEAHEIYQRWQTLSPDSAVAAHYLLVCENADQSPDRASEDYVKQTFDNFADDFDVRLESLEYRVPDRLTEQLGKWVSLDRRGELSVVDLGCGTGLCGPKLRAFADHLVGVDLSKKMLAKAEQRDVYDQLLESELTKYLLGQTACHDILFSADTLLYIGDLRSTFDAAAGAMRPGGVFAFSLEKLNPDSEEPASAASANASDEAENQAFRLGLSGRYVHHEPSVRQWLGDSGFETKSFVETELRKEGFADVIGYLIIAVRNQDPKSAKTR